MPQHNAAEPPRHPAGGSLLLTLRQGSPSEAALALRRRLFRAGREADGDAQDAQATHAEVAVPGQGVVASLRFRCFSNARLAESYAAQSYDLAGLARLPGPKVEIGRFCALPHQREPQVLRLLLGAVDEAARGFGATFLFGCSSFPGTDPAPHLAGLAWAWTRHSAPWTWSPGERAPLVIRARDIAPVRASPNGLPQLLRFYLGLGARVSHHAVIDRDLGTIHLFTGLDLSSRRG